MTDTRVLTADEVDLVELVLGGGLDTLPLVPRPKAGTVLTDAENTPLAQIDTEGDLTALKPLAIAAGALGDPAVRRSATDTRAETSTAGRVLGVWLPEAPTRAEDDAILAAAGAAGDALLFVPAARHTVPGSAVRPAGRLRIARNLAERIHSAHSVATTVVVVPWPSGEISGELDPRDVMTSYGASEHMRIPRKRTPRQIAAIGAMENSFATAARDIYSPVAAAEVIQAHQHSTHTGTVVFFTGFSGSGKSTIAKALAADLEGEGTTVTLLDGDEVRHHLSKGLGFSREDRETNVERIGYAASLIGKHGGLAIAAPIAPFASARQTARRLAEEAGARFLLVWISTSLEVCEQRDRKGLYAKARAGEIPDFTGISSPYEKPTDADLVIDAGEVSIEDAVALVKREL
ncbi:adenylyl-sulfate kinase [Brevibacterium litoralis]|uniref:adenylyl-sulfate kinase n=1 Tax=Brevibacterium litoralis TaxID=3138935 RepID=UPI0032EE47EB